MTDTRGRWSWEEGSQGERGARSLQRGQLLTSRILWSRRFMFSLYVSSLFQG